MKHLLLLSIPIFMLLTSCGSDKKKANPDWKDVNDELIVLEQKKTKALNTLQEVKEDLPAINSENKNNETENDTSKEHNYFY